MQKLEFIVGQKVRGYGLLNEFGEFDFIPEQTGINKGKRKVVKTTADYSLSTTKKYILLNIRLPKLRGLELIKSFMNITNNLIDDFRRYDF